MLLDWMSVFLLTSVFGGVYQCGALPLQTSNEESIVNYALLTMLLIFISFLPTLYCVMRYGLKSSHYVKHR